MLQLFKIYLDEHILLSILLQVNSLVLVRGIVVEWNHSTVPYSSQSQTTAKMHNNY